MNLEQKINAIGRILADIQFEIKSIKRNQKELKDFLIDVDKLYFERLYKKLE